MTTPAEPKVEIVAAGTGLVPEPGRRASSGFTTHYDVICSRCGPVAIGQLYPSATRERIDHLCRPRTRRD